MTHAFARNLRLGLYGLSVGISLAYAWLAANRSFFFADEMGSLLFLKQHGLPRFLVEPLNVQFVPLHRLVSWLLDGLFGTFFEGHVVVTLLLQLAVLWMLRRLLIRLVGDGTLAAALVLAHASYAILGVNFLWYSSTLHRLPYLLATFWAFDLWLDYRQQGGVRRLVGIGTAMVLAEGFYAKGALLPFHVAAFELGLSCCAWRPASGAGATASSWRRRWLALAPLMLLAIGVALGAQQLAQAEFADQVKPTTLGAIMGLSFRVLSASLIGGIRPESYIEVPAWEYVYAGWAGLYALVLVSVFYDRRRLLAWLAIAGCFVGNTLVLALSNRGTVWGALMALNYRYYIDVFAVVVPMLALVLAPLPADAPLNAPAPPGSSPTATGPAGPLVVAVLAVALAVSQVSSFTYLMNFHYAGHLETRRIIDTLKREAQRVARALPPDARTLQNELLPTPLIGIPGRYGMTQHLVAILDLPLTPSDDGQLVMQDDGRLVPKPAGFRLDRRVRARRAEHWEMLRRAAQRWRETR